MRDVCDVAYVLLVGQLERQVLADRHLAVVMNASGRYRQEVPVPELGVHRRLLDEALVEVPRVLSAVDSKQMELRRALGVG